MAKYLFVISGFSGAGKDTVASIIDEICWRRAFGGYLYRNFKFAAPGKRALEYMLGCKPGLLDDREKRLQIAPNCQGRTYLQVLIDFYHHRDDVIGSDLFPSKVISEIDSFFNVSDNSDTVTTITDMRSVSEYYHLCDWLAVNDDVELIPLWIDRPGVEALSSDKISYRLFLGLVSKSNIAHAHWCKISNHGSVNTLRDIVQETVVRLLFRLAMQELYSNVN